MVESIILGLGLLSLAGVLGYGMWSGRLEFRPFRTSMVAVSGGLILALWLVLQTVGVEGYPGGLIDGTVIGVVFTALATAIVKLADDGGESDAVKIVDRFIEERMAKDE